MTIWGSAADDVWAATNSDVVLHWNGTVWSASSVVETGSVGGEHWRSVSGTDANDVWLTGSRIHRRPPKGP
jgi:hypothetical protein